MIHNISTGDANFYINLLRQLPGLIVVLDKKSRFVYSNQYTANMFGYTNEENILGLDANDLRCPAVESATEFISQDKIVMETGHSLTILDIHTYAPDQEKILLTKKIPYIVDRERVGIICHCTEINSSDLSSACSALIQSDKQYYKNQRSINRSYMLGTPLSRKNLSVRELECVFYLLRGKTMKQIGVMLKISPRTVETYIENIKYKLNCSSRAEIIDFCLSEGLLNYIPSNLLSRNISGIIYINTK